MELQKIIICLDMEGKVECVFAPYVDVEVIVADDRVVPSDPTDAINALIRDMYDIPIKPLKMNKSEKKS